MNKYFEPKLVNNYIFISFDKCFGDQKNCLPEMVLLSTHNIRFSLELRKTNFKHSYVEADHYLHLSVF